MHRFRFGNIWGCSNAEKVYYPDHGYLYSYADRNDPIREYKQATYIGSA